MRGAPSTSHVRPRRYCWRHGSVPEDEPSSAAPRPLRSGQPRLSKAPQGHRRGPVSLSGHCSIYRPFLLWVQMWVRQNVWLWEVPPAATRSEFEGWPGRSVIVTLSLGQRAVTENTADNLPPATAGGALDSGDRASACVSSQKSVLPRTLTRRTHPASSSFYSTDLGSQRPRTGSLYPSDAKYENRNTKAGR